MSKILWIKYKP